MRCAACGKSNLEGGVRCVYCGTPFPRALDFDISSPGSGPTIPAGPSPGTKPPPGKARSGRLVGTISLLILKGKSLFTLFKFGKILLTFSTMLLSIWAYSHIFGWKFSVGLVICIFIHEMGHVVVNWSKGLKQSAPMFIPFMGAVIFLKQFPDDPTIQSESGAGGPVAGMLAALGCAGIWKLTGNPFWEALAHFGFFINLFNLIPFPPLDGSHISSVFSPKVWNAVLIVLAMVALKSPPGLLWGIVLVSFVFRLGRSDDGRHLLATPAVRARMAIVYATLCLVLAFGATNTHLDPAQIGRTQPVSSRVQSPVPAGQVNSDSTTAHEDLASGGSGGLSAAAAFLIRVIAYGLAAALWTITSLLVVTAYGVRPRPRNAILPVGMIVLLGCLDAALSVGMVSHAAETPIMGAYFASALGGLIFAGYQYAHRETARHKSTPAIAVGRCRGWAVFAALLVAYAANSLATAAVVALCMAGYLAANRWVVPYQSARLAEQWNETTRALAAYHRAADFAPDTATEAHIWAHIAHLNIVLARGGDALEALARKEAIQGAPLNAPSELREKITALLLLERHEEALTACEQLLRAEPGDPTGPVRLLLTHAALAELAWVRGWHDETIAQTDWFLTAAPKTARAAAAAIRILKAQALLQSGRKAEAEAECDEAIRVCREPTIEMRASTARAQIALFDGNAEAALQSLKPAERLNRDSLNVRFWRGCALIAAGQGSEGRELLREIAAAYPGEYWGRRALAAVQP